MEEPPSGSLPANFWRLKADFLSLLQVSFHPQSQRALQRGLNLIPSPELASSAAIPRVTLRNTEGKMISIPGLSGGSRVNERSS